MTAPTIMNTIDYFGERCCVCDAVTTSEPHFNVYTARITIKEEKTGFRETTTTTTVRDVWEHPCRVCDACRRKIGIICGIIFVIGLALTVAFYISQREMISMWRTWQKLIPGGVGLLLAGLLFEQIENRIGHAAKAKMRAATVRGVGYTGMEESEYKSLD